MALVGTIALASGGPVTTGRAANFTLSIRNTGGSDVTPTQIITYALPAGTAGRVEPISLPPGSSLTIAAGGTSTFNFQGVFYVPNIVGQPAGATPRFTICASIVAGSDSAEAQQLVIQVNPAVSLTQLQNPTSPGNLDFTLPANTGLLALPL